MNLTQTVSLAPLVCALRGLASSGSGPRHIAQAVAGHLRTGGVTAEMWRGLIAGAVAPGLHREVLHAEPSFSIQTVAWAPGEQTPVHDHIAWCVVAVLAGTLTEWRYDDRGDHLDMVDRMEFPAGRVDGFAPPGDIHHVCNPGTEPAVSLHIYGADLRDGLTSVRRTYDLPVRHPA
jgi:predicted metal-dependent enzyme (double-stranded beta helix superfamily)